MKNLIALLCCCFLFVIPNSSQAADFGTAMSIASANISPGADVAGMGNCWIALPDFSSNNPAVIAAGEKFHFGASYTFGLLMFKHGPNITMHQTSITAVLPKGVAQLTLSNANSGSAGTAMDVDAKFAYLPSIELMYGLKVGENLLRDGDKLYLGAGGSLSTSKMNFSLAGQNVLISRSRKFEAKAGFLYQPAKGLNFGGMYSYSRDRNDDRELNINEEDGSQTWSAKRYNSDAHQFRLGASWQILPTTLVAVDYQHLNIGHVRRDQIFAGVEQQIIKDRLYVYGGWAVSGPTAGIGVYFKNVTLNVAYQNNTLDDLDPHLGRSQTIMATIGGQF
jgi:hypothetical protein